MKYFKRKENTHVVLKVADIQKAFGPETRLQLERMLSFISGYRHAKNKEACPTYLVVNMDEPYAAKVLEVIKEGELSK